MSTEHEDNPARGFLGSRRAERTAVLGLMALAFVLRLVYVLQMRSNPHFDRPIMDALYHVQWAQAFAAGEDFQPGPFFRAPLYVWFLGLVQKVFGAGLLAPRLVQCALGAATTGLTYLVGRQVFDRRVGFLAGLAAASYWVLVYFDGELLIPTLAVPLDLLALWLTLRLTEDEKPRAAVLAGLAWGVSAIARPNVLLFAPFVALWIVWLRRPVWKRGLAPAALFGGALLAPILPLTVYNATTGGDAVLISSQGGVNLWIGNNPQSDGSTAIVPGTRGGWWEGYHDAIALAETAEGRKLAPSEVSRHYARRAWSWIASEPGAALAHFGWKLRLFWTDWELGNNQEARFFANRFSPLVRFLPLGFAVIAGFGLFGLALSLRGGARTFPLWGFVLVYTASVVAFFVCSRFRVPVLPPLMIFGAHAVFWLVDQVRGRRFVPAVTGAVCITLGVLGSRQLPKAVRTTDANGYWQLGVASAAAGEPLDAIMYLREAVALDPRNVFARVRLAHAWLATSSLVAAEQELEEALKVDPGSADALDLLLDVLLRQERNAECEARCKAAIAAAPHLAVPRFHLGRIRFAERRFAEARRLFAEALERDPRHFPAAYSLGAACEELGEVTAAIAAFERAVGLSEFAEPPFDRLAREKLAALRGD